jgi:exodeoxyribonuclease VII large subunit
MSRNVTHDGAGRIEIRFPFDRVLVELVKGLPSRRWNADSRFWSVPESEVVPLVDLLNGRGFEFDRATRELYRALGGQSEPVEVRPPRPVDAAPGSQPSLFDEVEEARGAPGDLTVTGLNERARDALAAAFPAPVWVVGEISGFEKSAHKRHVTFELVERTEDGRAVSKVPAVLFQDMRQTIEDALHLAGDPFRLTDELTIRAKVTVDLYATWGQYRVVLEEIDLRYTLGEAARRRDEIIARLAAAGLLGRNTLVPVPALPLRIGLITSLGSDAYNDVLRTLEESRLAFHVTAHGARVQGHATEASVLNALDWFRARIDEFDVVLICRGGGSRTDLVWFDSEPLGRAVAEFPLPVVVGIGHEQDRSVLDAVGRSAKTPTAAAGLLVELVRAQLERVDRARRAVLAAASAKVEAGRLAIDRDGRRLARTARERLSAARARLDLERRRVVLGARGSIERARLGLDRQATWIPRGARRTLERERISLARAVQIVRQGPLRDLRAAGERAQRHARDLLTRTGAAIARAAERADLRARRLHLVHPRRVVERGYAILRDEDGRVVTSAAAVSPDRLVRAELRNGILRLRSVGPEPCDPSEKG